MNQELFERVKSHKSYLISNNGMGFYNYLFTYLSISSKRNNEIDYSNFKNYSKLNHNEKLIIDTITMNSDKISANQAFDLSQMETSINKANQFLRDTLIVARTQNSIFLLDSIFDYPKADLLKINLTSKDIVEQKLMLETVLSNTKTKWCRKVIQSEYEKSLVKLISINERLNKSKTFVNDNNLGQPISEMPFGAKLYRADTINSNTLLSNIKSSFKGKALLIDFWATWCNPCLQEMPYSKKLHEETKDLPIEFIYLCTSRGSNVEQWQLKIAEFELKGTHIFVEQDIVNELMSLFSVNVFPSYVFINSEGEYKAGAVSNMSIMDKNKLIELINEK